MVNNNNIIYIEFATKETIINSFVIKGIMVDFDDSEGDKFNFLTHISDYIDDNMDNKNCNIIKKQNNQIINLPKENKYTINILLNILERKLLMKMKIF